MTKKVLIGGEAVPISQTKTKLFAPKSPTPMWAKWVFRGTTVLTTVLAIWVNGTDIIAAGAKTETMLLLKCIDAAVLLLSKAPGRVKK